MIGFQQVDSAKKLNFFLIILGLSSIAYLKTMIVPILYIPLLTAFYLILNSHPIMGIYVIISYLSVEGVYKLFSGYAVGLRLAMDMMTFACLFKTWFYLKTERKSNQLFNVPLKVLFLLHIFWILVQFLNPNGIGLIPSLASYKTYISNIMLYFVASILVKSEEDFLNLAKIAVYLVILQCVTSIYQFNIGEAGLISIHPGYIAALSDKFTKQFFRPFGTSNVVAGGVTFIFLLAPFVFYFCLIKKSLRWTILSYFTVLLSVYTLFISQVRAAILKSAVGALILIIILSIREPKKGIYFLLMLLVLSFIAPSLISENDPRMAVAQKRLSALTNLNAEWSDRSNGMWESTLMIMKDQPFGIGLSRVGAGSGPFADIIKKHERYRSEWSFADNLYKAVIIEMGIPGLIFYISFVFGTIYILGSRIKQLLYKTDISNLALICASFAMAVSSIFGYTGSEGPLYQPEASIFWIFVGAAMGRSKSLLSST